MPIAQSLIKSSSSAISGLYQIVRIPEIEERQLRELCDSLQSYLSSEEIEEVKSAYEVGSIAHHGQVRLEGDKYINHPLSVARLLAELQLDSHTIIAAILHDTLEDTNLTKQALIDKFGKDVANLVEGVTKVSNVEFETVEHAEAENLKRMLMAVSGDVRTMLIKLADRLHNMDSMHVHRLEKRKRIVRQTREIYIPLAHMFGMYSWQLQLEDLCFKALYPNRYAIISKAIQRDVRKAEQNIKRHVSAIEKLLKQRGLAASVTGRLKHMAAIHEKMRRKGNSLSAVLDLFAFRIVVNRIDDCYRALGIVHSRYKPISGEFNDFIAIPKINGYQSLHTTVHGEFGRMIEIQIRTEEMHRVAETGIASHLRYKSGVNSSTSVNFPSVQWLSDVLHSLEEHESPGEYLGNLKLSLFSDDVFVFTPKGEIKRLKRGATVIDFAYSVHSDVGNRAKQAYVNSQRVGFHTILSNGDHVEIVHKRGGKPDPGWLNFAVTGKARMSIRNALKKSSRKDVEKMGKRLFKNALKKYSIRSSDITDAMKDKLVSRLNLQSWSDVVYDVGMGQRMAAVIVRQMIPDLFKESNPADTPDYSVAIQGTEGLGVQYGGCCNPIPNDDIVGFFSRGRGIVIHNVTCQNVHQSKYGPENWGKFHWVDYPQGTFRVPIRLDVMNKKGVLAEITARIAALETNISACNISTHGESAVIEFEIDVTDRKHLARIIKGLKRNTSVHKIQRIKFR